MIGTLTHEDVTVTPEASGNFADVTFTHLGWGFTFSLRRHTTPKYVDPDTGEVTPGGSCAVWMIERPGDFPVEYANETGRRLPVGYGTMWDAVHGLITDANAGRIPAAWGKPQ